MTLEALRLRIVDLVDARTAPVSPGCRAPRVEAAVPGVPLLSGTAALCLAGTAWSSGCRVGFSVEFRAPRPVHRRAPTLGAVKVLVIGSGAREHALVQSLAADPMVDVVIAAPGNPGIARIARCEPLSDVTDSAAIVQIAQQQAADLVVIGPEAPLVAGVGDALRAAGITAYGPTAAAAALEGSKAFAKEVMSAAEVPTGLAHVCTSMAEVADALDALGAPHVVKADGLAAGKGVVVTRDRDIALAHARSCLETAASRVVIEEYLDGPEVSLFCICDGQDVVPLAPAQDFKRVGDDDTGPNTGGMGAYSPLDWAPDDLVSTVVDRIARPTVTEMARRGIPFAGTLFIGLALTARGPKVIEFNVRFGDPETQVVLARLRSPLGQLLDAAARGHLASVEPMRWSADHAVAVVVAAADYPGPPRTGDRILGVDELAVGPAQGGDGGRTAYVLHAGTALGEDGTLLSAGGRVLSVEATGGTLDEARDAVYAAVGRIDLVGSHHRSDIALRAVRGEIRVAG